MEPRIGIPDMMAMEHSTGGGFIVDSRRQPLPVHERIVRPVSLEQERRHMIITPESLQNDNTSSESERLRGEWEDYRRSGNQKVLLGCSDPRFVLDPLSYTVRSIAAGLDPNSFQNLFNQENVRAIIASTHHDGTTFRPGEHPTGCGGLRAKEAEAPVNEDEDEDGLAAFVRKQVVHPDTLVQACATAASIAEVTDKPVLAMTQDHRTRLDIPLAILSDRGHTMHYSSAIRRIFQGAYNPRELYANGIPSLDDDQLGIFRDYMIRNRNQVAALKNRFSDLTDVQAKNRPLVTAVSTEVRPSSIRYPKTIGLPGTTFMIKLPQYLEYGVPRIHINDVRNVAAQLQFPMDNANKNHGRPEDSFGTMHRFLIETDSIEVSEALAEEFLASSSYVQEWAKQPENRIILAEVQHGVTQEARWYTVK